MILAYLFFYNFVVVINPNYPIVMKNIISLLLGLLPIIGLQAQEVKPVILKSPAANVEYFAENNSRPSLLVEELPIIPTERQKEELQIKLSSNPVLSFLSIILPVAASGQVVIDLWGAQGEHLRHQVAELAEAHLLWDMNPLPPGIYQLSFAKESGDLVKAYQVSKFE